MRALKFRNLFDGELANDIKGRVYSRRFDCLSAESKFFDNAS